VSACFSSLEEKLTGEGGSKLSGFFTPRSILAGATIPIHNRQWSAEIASLPESVIKELAPGLDKSQVRNLPFDTNQELLTRSLLDHLAHQELLLGALTRHLSDFLSRGDQSAETGLLLFNYLAELNTASITSSAALLGNILLHRREEFLAKAKVNKDTSDRLARSVPLFAADDALFSAQALTSVREAQPSVLERLSTNLLQAQSAKPTPPSVPTAKPKGQAGGKNRRGGAWRG
jgi:hypothetical protein